MTETERPTLPREGRRWYLRHRRHDMVGITALDRTTNTTRGMNCSCGSEWAYTGTARYRWGPAIKTVIVCALIFAFVTAVKWVVGYAQGENEKREACEDLGGVYIRHHCVAEIDIDG